MGKRQSLKMQVIRILNSKTTFGEKRHDAKKEKREELKLEKQKELKEAGQTVKLKDIKIQSNEVILDGIYSYSSFEGYKQKSIQFVKWLEQNHPEIKFIRDSHHLAAEYLQSLVDRQLAPTSVSGHGSALAKLFGQPAESFGFNFPEKRQEDIFKGRSPQPWDESIRKNYQEELAVLSVVGLRRHETIGLKVSQISKDYSMLYNVKGKNGKLRDVEVLNPELLKQYVESHPRDNNNIFPTLPEKMNIQLERRNYAKEYYRREEDRIYPEKEKINIREKDEKGKMLWYVTRQEENSRAYLKEILEKISINLGHERLEVVVRNYLN